MRTLLFLTLFSVSPLILNAQAPAPAAPAAPTPALNAEQEVENLLTEAQTSFTQGKFDVALQKLGAIHTKTSNRDFEAVMFLEGACHFNLKQYGEAVKFFEDFITKFPESGSINDARMAVGEAYLLSGNPDKGIAALKEAAAIEELRDKAGMMIASHYKKENKPDDSLAILEVILKDLSGSPSQEQQQAILMASDIYLGKGDTEKAQQMMDKLRSGSKGDESVVQLNVLSQKIGDEMLEAKRYGEALRAYQNVRRQSELVRLQKQRIARIEQWIATLNQPGGRVVFMGRLLGKEEAASMLEQNKTILAEVEGVKDYDAGIFYRLGQCFYEMQRYYESMLAFQTIYEKYREYKDRDRCLFGMIVCNAALKRSVRAMALSERYMTEFPEGANYGNVTDMLASLAVESGDSTKAKDVLRVALQQKDADKERLNFLLGVVCFEMQDFDEARMSMEAVLEGNKNSGFRDPAMYYISLTYFFQNNSVKFIDSAEDYIAANPKGDYVVDARYRIAFIKLQAGKTGQKGGDIQGAREILETLVKDSPNDPNIGQVLSLLGDIYAETSDPDGKVDYNAMALDHYRRAVDKARSPDVLNYAIDAANNLMQEKELWPEIIAMWSVYYNANKGKPESLKAIHYIATARERQARKDEKEGKAAEAKKQRDDARSLVAKETLPHLGNPANEQVEVLIQQLVTMIVPKKRPRAVVPAESAPTGDSSAAAPVAEVKIPTFEEVENEFKTLLTPESGQLNGTASARVLYGRALIARGFRDVPKYENLISIIPDAAKAEEMSPLLLAVMGEIMFKKGDNEKAGQYYQQIRAKYPNSEFADRAPNGLGEIEFQKKEYQAALDLFNEAIEKYAFSEESILTGSLGKAKCYKAMLKWDEAEKLYSTILNTREWRSAHPTALLGLGEVWDGKKDYAKAITFYRKVLLAWRKDKTILFQAYLNCAKAYVANGDSKSAREMLEEMLRQKELVEYADLQSEAQQLISKVSS